MVIHQFLLIIFLIGIRPSPLWPCFIYHVYLQQFRGCCYLSLFIYYLTYSRLCLPFPHGFIHIIINPLPLSSIVYLFDVVFLYRRTANFLYFLSLSSDYRSISCYIFLLRRIYGSHCTFLPYVRFRFPFLVHNGIPPLPLCVDYQITCLRLFWWASGLTLVLCLGWIIR